MSLLQRFKENFVAILCLYIESEKSMNSQIGTEKFINKVFKKLLHLITPSKVLILSFNSS